MERFQKFVFDFHENDIYPAPEEGKARLEVPVREVTGQMATHRRNGALGAVLSQLVNSGSSDRLAGQVVEYLFDTNEHPTLVQGVLNFCYHVLVKAGYKLEAAYVDGRLEAGKKLTTKLAKLVDDGDLPAGLPLV